ncbi:MAG TPA: AmmeMemoRadiSam system radical SAM enzyme, partial [Lentisphaeria bacterium]|nr:AmmeMemoRadiSam system radical SAM enzyme [Lentisphaeria bacterium]
MPDNPARFYTRLPEGAVRCDLCPRRCVITPGGAGWCRMRCNAAGELHALS